MYKLLCIDTTWEKEYLLFNLFRDIQFEDFYFIDMNQLSFAFLNHFYDPKYKYVVSISTNHMSYDKCFTIVNKLKPHVLVLSSDEMGRCPEVLELHEKVPLVLSQYIYYHPKYINKILHLPLSHTNCILPKEIVAGGCLNKEKTYVWSFVGSPKSDRQQAIDIFKKSFDKGFSSWNESKEKTSEIYASSTFVLSPRGNQSIVCFRTFEALRSGAIPVVVAQIEEIEKSYYFGDKHKQIPFIYTNTWENAQQICKDLLNNPSDLLTKQRECAAWINSIEDNLRDHVNKTLK